MGSPHLLDLFCGAAAEEALRLHEEVSTERRKLEGRPHISDSLPGTTAYRKGCRCDDCRAANAKASAKRIQMWRNGSHTYWC